MSRDIGPILAGWDFDPDETQVRIVQGADGCDKIQMRIDLGLIQMELDGRPDGQRPCGCESLLDHYEHLATQHQEPGADQPAEASPFPLDSKACAELFREGLQYYHRYLACFHLERYDLVARDTKRNLRLFAFVVRHAAGRHDKLQFDQYRPYVTMMHARACAQMALALADYPGAIDHVERAIEKIRRFLKEYDQDERSAKCPELSFLLQWRERLQRERPLGPVERLEQQLHLAVAREQFEEAARLRDQIRRLRTLSQPPDAPPGPPLPGARQGLG